MSGHCELAFSIAAPDRVIVTRYDGVEIRPECALELLCDLARNWPELMVGRSGGIWYDDNPPGEAWLKQHDLPFCTTKHRRAPSPYLPFPCPMFLRWPQVGIPDAESMMEDLLNDHSAYEDERIFWIGANTHPSRVRLCEIGRTNPEVFDTELMQWDRRAPGGQRSKTRQVSIPGHRKYKYLIDCPGVGYSARVKWLLATGRPLFLVDRPAVEPWDDDLIPWVHYVPVAADLSDLVKHRARLEEDPDLYEAIGKNARQFAAEHLTVEARLNHTAHAVWQATEGTKPRHRTPPKTVENVGQRLVQETGEITQALREYVASGTHEPLWIMDEKVWLDGDWEEFRHALATSEADFLATEIRAYADNPDWHWWPSLAAPGGENPLESGMAALLPLIRVSRAAAETMLKGINDGWRGHPEGLMPTLVNRAGLKIEDIGGDKSFAPPERTKRWYDEKTWHWKGPVEYVPGKLHFPVPIQTRPLAPGRIEDCRLQIEDHGLKMLYVSPVGGGARELLPDVLGCFLAAGADCWLLQYDDAALEAPDGVRLIRDKGHKWQLALRHLHPDMVEEYDFIFFWDDDLGVKEFDPQRFTRIMRTNRLDMAQPSIESPHGLSHPVTKRHPCPVPWRGQNGEFVRNIVGRLTNFVEIMAPVFTRAAWREFHGYLNPENQSGWGYDYIPLGRKGIIDALPVVHTRAVQSINGDSESELRRFLEEQGLCRHEAVKQGWLFE